MAAACSFEAFEPVYQTTRPHLLSALYLMWKRSYCFEWYINGLYCQISALDRVQNKAAKFVHHSGNSDWESLAQRRKIARMCALYRAYTGERAWKAVGDRLQAPSYLSRVDYHWKIRARNKEQTYGNTPLWIGPLLTGTGYLKGL